MRRLLLKTSVVVASTLVALLLAEAALRVFFRLTGRDIDAFRPTAAYNLGDAGQSVYVSHPFLPFAQRPFDRRTVRVFRPETGRTYTYVYALNSLGFRTPERPFEKPAGVKRVVTLGGSTTVEGFTDAETWPARLEAKLNETYAGGGARVEVINLGVNMAASPTSLVNLQLVGLEYGPDLVISYDGVNDTNLLGFEGAAPDYRNVYGDFDERYRSWQSALPAWAFRSYLLTRASFALDRARGGADIGSQVMRVGRLKRSPDALAGAHLFERNLRLQRAASREGGAKYLAATAHWVAPDAKVAAVNERLRLFFAREGIDYIDLDALLPHGDWSLHTDDVHWTREGVERVAEEMRKKIVEGNLLGM